MAHGFEVVRRRPVAQGRFISLQELELRAPDGSTILRDVVAHPGAVAMVALTGKDVILIRQYRAAVDDKLLEIPAGKLDAGEDPRRTAARELVEEVGYHPGRLTELGSYFATPGFSDERLTLYLAEDLEARPSQPHGPEEEAAEVVVMPLGDAYARARDGGFADAKTLIGILIAGSRVL